MTGLLPIKTAPRDGTPILAHWADATPPPFPAVVVWEGLDWRFAHSETRTRPPTHWQPLPVVKGGRPSTNLCSCCGQRLRAAVDGITVSETGEVTRKDYALVVFLQPALRKFLEVLLDNPGRVVFHDEIVAAVSVGMRGAKMSFQTRKVQATNLRKAIEPLGLYLENEHGLGYWLRVGS